MRPTLENIRSLGNATQLIRWEVAFATIPRALAGMFPGNDALNWRASSMSIPTMNPGATEIIIRGHKTIQPGIADYGGNTITLTSIEFVDNIMAQFISNWRFACWSNSNGGSGITLPKADLEAVIVLTRLDNEDNPIWQYEIIGCWPSTTDPGGELGGEDASPLKPVITLSFDYFKDYMISPDI